MITMTGPIEKGDAQRLRAFVARHGASKPPEWNPDDQTSTYGESAVLSLDSEGGDFREGIELGRAVWELRLATLVERDAQCLSACAVAFMYGNALDEISHYPSRHLEAGGKIGFHRPVLDDLDSFDISVFEDLPQQEIDAIMREEYATFYDLANQLIQDMLAIDPSAWPTSLLMRMLLATGRGGDRFIMIETTGDAMEWDITLHGIKAPAPRNRREFFRDLWWSCYNAYYQVMDRFDRMRIQDVFSVDMIAREYREKEYGREFLKFDIALEPIGNGSCTFDLNLHLHSVNNKTARGGGLGIGFNDGYGVQYLYSPNAKLADIAGAWEPFDDAKWADWLAARLGRCRLYQSGALLRAERCDRERVYFPELGGFVETYAWPSGERTVLAPYRSGGSLMTMRYT